MCDLVDANKIVHKSLTSGAGGGWTDFLVLEVLQFAGGCGLGRVN